MVFVQFIRYLLFPLALLYGGILWLRNTLYDYGWLKSTAFDIPMISVGNLRVGGTGKTPHIEYLIRLLKTDHRLAVLSRGYGRQTKGFYLAKTNHNAKILGDEPLQFYTKYGNNLKVAVCENRVHGVQKLLDIFPSSIDAFLLDDAFQHRAIKIGYSILLTSFNDPFNEDWPLPTGYLREFTCGARRADCVIVTHSPSTLSESEKKIWQKKLQLQQKQQLFFSHLSYDSFVYNLDGKMLLQDLTSTPIVLLTGIANPKPLYEYLIQQSISIAIHLQYADHHHFTKSELAKINHLARTHLILTTEKDYMRLKDHAIPSLFYLPIFPIIDNEKLFNQTILHYVTKN